MLVCQQQRGVTMKDRLSLGQILMPTKGADSYPKIANRANEWLRKQTSDGRQLSIRKISSEQVRKIFSDEVERPASIYLEALAAAQNINVMDLYEAAGYHFANQEPSDPMERCRVNLRSTHKLSECAIQQILDYAAEKMAEEEQEKL